MIIMSKDKETLYNFGEGCTLFICLNKNGGHLIVAISPGVEHSHIELGDYDSKEECKQIIQSILCTAQLDDKYFYMPEE